MKTKPALLLPALRAKFGDWWYYVTTMTFSQVGEAIQPVDEIHEKKELTTWIQREIQPERRQQIATYLTDQPQRFFNALVVGIYGGEPAWFPVTVGNSPNLKEIEVTARPWLVAAAIRTAWLRSHRSQWPSEKPNKP